MKVGPLQAFGILKNHVFRVSVPRMLFEKIWQTFRPVEVRASTPVVARGQDNKQDGKDSQATNELIAHGYMAQTIFRMLAPKVPGGISFQPGELTVAIILPAAIGSECVLNARYL